MPTIKFTTFDGTGQVHNFLDKFDNFVIIHGLDEQQIISLLFMHLKGTAVEWYAAEVEKHHQLIGTRLPPNFSVG